MLDHTLGVSVDAQVRANTIIRQLIDTKGDFYREGRSVLGARWAKMAATVADCVVPLALSNARSEGPNAWLRFKNGTNSTAMLQKVGLTGINGIFFGAGAEYVRLNMLDSDSTMALMLEALATLCSGGAGTETVKATAAGIVADVNKAKTRFWRRRLRGGIF